jgi:hypothetical protein
LTTLTAETFNTVLTDDNKNAFLLAASNTKDYANALAHTLSFTLQEQQLKLIKESISK